MLNTRLSDVQLYCIHWKLRVYCRPQLRPELVSCYYLRNSSNLVVLYFLTSEVICQVDIDGVEGMDLCEALLLMSACAVLERIRTRLCTYWLCFMTLQFHRMLFYCSFDKRCHEIWCANSYQCSLAFPLLVKGRGLSCLYRFVYNFLLLFLHFWE